MKGIVLLGEDEQIEARARNHNLRVLVDPQMGMPWDKVLYTEPGIEIPWDLLPAAWHFLKRWDAAVPLWRYSVNACDVGSKEERKCTKEMVRDLRVLLHAVELLFVRDSEMGKALLNAYRHELGTSENKRNKRLAFLRAYYEVKPRLCVLPRTWLAQVYARSKMDAKASMGARQTASKLVQVELQPGRFVQCQPGDEEKVRAMLMGERIESPPEEEHKPDPLVRIEVSPGRFVKCRAEDRAKVLAMHQGGR